MTTTQPLTDEQLNTIHLRAESATSGPWGWFDGSDYADVVADYQSTGPGSYQCRQKVASIEADWTLDDPEHDEWDESQASEQACADADFIAHARTDVPALLAEATRLRAELAKYVGHEPTLREEMAYLRRCLDAAEALLPTDPAEDTNASWIKPRHLRAALNGDTAAVSVASA